MGDLCAGQRHQASGHGGVCGHPSHKTAALGDVARLVGNGTALRSPLFESIQDAKDEENAADSMEKLQKQMLEMELGTSLPSLSTQLFFVF